MPLAACPECLFAKRLDSMLRQSAWPQVCLYAILVFRYEKRERKEYVNLSCATNIAFPFKLEYRRSIITLLNTCTFTCTIDY